MHPAFNLLIFLGNGYGICQGGQYTLGPPYHLFLKVEKLYMLIHFYSRPVYHIRYNCTHQKYSCLPDLSTQEIQHCFWRGKKTTLKCLFISSFALLDIFITKERIKPFTSCLNKFGKLKSKFTKPNLSRIANEYQFSGYIFTQEEKTSSRFAMGMLKK